MTCDVVCCSEVEGIDEVDVVEIMLVLGVVGEREVEGAEVGLLLAEELGTLVD